LTPARRKSLTEAVDLIADVTNHDAWAICTEATRDALIGMGASFVDGNTNTMRLGGITASCTFDKGEHLLLRWAANARAALTQGTDASPSSDEEE
jgi:hypothetical protein